MFVEFRISPARQGLLETSDARRSEILDESGFDGHSGTVQASLEGSWDRVMSVIHDCHAALVNGYPRIVTTIVIVDDHVDDHDNGWPKLLHEMVPSLPDQVRQATQPARRIPVEYHQ
jgi:uncharacterized protein YqgV (UPF0045/DUF77 family)